MMKTASKREQRRRQQRQKWMKYAIGGGVGLLILSILGLLVWQSAKPSAGEASAIPADASTHVKVGAALSYPSDPPAGGPHYADEFKNGFYDENNLPNQPGDPAGCPVHNLEHGYVIFWYNCSNLDQAGCNDLKTKIKSVMDARNNFKLIAYPWKSIDTPLVMTSLGRLQSFKQFDANQARAFIENNLNRAPEPEAQ